jgi:uncharacterized metal-binding protein
MAEECTCKAEEIIFLPCSGGSNCGQIANRAAVNLNIEKVGRIYCLAGIAAHIDGMVDSARSAKRIVARWSDSNRLDMCYGGRNQ